ncbi:MAG: TIGR01458 family HAD-type hydrolase [Calditrichia bacterium]|jgi:HAD superfamily hydrolase (TIGR01458 family)
MPRQIAGFLIDIDGVLTIDNQRVDGAVEAINFLQDRKIPFLLVTNTTRQSRITIWHHLKRIGFPIEETDIITAPIAAAGWLKSRGIVSVNLFLSGSAVNDFKDFKITAFNPEYVVVGDLGPDLTFDKLNNAFRLIMNGAKILALQKNRFWQTGEGLTIDAGAMVAALEYATNKRATIIGKPRKEFFLQAAGKLKIPAQELAMVGDDLETDIEGGQNAGLFGIAVKTGKFREEFLQQSKIKPGAIIDSIAELPEFIIQK